jgi:serine/threonine-protein kinase SRK2
MRYILAGCQYPALPVAAPEVISSGSYDGKKADIWSCGVMLYVMLYNAYPFEREEDNANNRTDALKMMRRILNMELEIPPTPRVSPEVIDLLLRILVKNPDDRLTVQEIQVCTLVPLQAT